MDDRDKTLNKKRIRWKNIPFNFSGEENVEMIKGFINCKEHSEWTEILYPYCARVA